VRLLHGKKSKALVIFLRNLKGFAADKITPGKHFCRLNFHFLETSLHKQLTAISRTCTQRLHSDPPPKDSLDLLEIVCSRMRSDSQSPNFAADFERDWESSHKEYTIIMDAVEMLVESCRLVPEHYAVIKAAITGSRSCVEIIVGCTGGGKSTLQAKIGIALFLLGQNIHFTSQTNVAVDELMRKVIEVALFLNAPSLPHCMARVYSTAREDLVNLNLEGATGGDVRIQPEESLGDDQVPKDLRFGSLSQLIHDHCVRNPGDVNVVEYLRHRNARAASKDIRSKRPMAPAAWVAENPPQTYEVAKTNI
jgi:hypothetical protein